jgi:hypothetical protein
MGYKNKAWNQARKKKRFDALRRRAARGNKGAALEYAERIRNQNIALADRRRAEDRRHELNKMKIGQDFDKKKTMYGAKQDRLKTKYEAGQDRKKTKYVEGEKGKRQEGRLDWRDQDREDKQEEGRDRILTQEQFRRKRDAQERRHELTKEQMRNKGKAARRASSGGRYDDLAGPNEEGVSVRAGSTGSYDPSKYRREVSTKNPVWKSSGGKTTPPAQPKQTETKRQDGIVSQKPKSTPSRKKPRGREISFFGGEGQPRGFIKSGGAPQEKTRNAEVWARQSRGGNPTGPPKKQYAEKKSKDVGVPVWKSARDARDALNKASSTLAKYDDKGNLKPEYVKRMKARIARRRKREKEKETA